MKAFTLLAFLLLPFFLMGQVADEAAIQQVDSLVAVSRSHAQQQDFEKALEAIGAAEKIALEKFGEETLSYGSCCHIHGYVLLVKGDLSSSEKWFLKGKAIREKILGKESPVYANSLNSLGLLYYHMGDYETAEPYYLEAKPIYEKTMGKEHPAYAGSLSNLANLYYVMGDYEKVEPYYLESKAIREKTLGKEDPDYVASLINLANLYHDMGNYDKAEPLYLEAKEIIDKTAGNEHPFYINCLVSLSNLYKSKGEYEKAEPLLLEANAYLKKTNGQGQAANTGQIDLANLYWAKGDYDKAEPLFISAKTNIEESQGKERPEYAKCLTGLANVYMDKGAYNKAESLFVEAKNITEKTMGNKSPDYANCLNNLSVLYETINKLTESEQLQKSYFELMQSRLIQSTTFLSERELASYVATFQANGNGLSSKLLARLQKNAPTGILPALDYDQALFQKGFLLTAVNHLNALAVSSPEAVALHSQLKSYRRRLAAELAKPLEEQSDAASLEEKANAAEKDLTRAVAGYAEAGRQVSWQEVQSALKPEEAALEFIEFAVNFPKSTDSTMYAALLLLPGKKAPLFLPLFEEKSLDSLLLTHGERRADYVNGLYTVADRGAKPLDKPAHSLYELLWQPLEKELANTKAIYFSPVGLLHRINIGAIPISEEETLADHYQLVELGSTRQLVIPSKVKNTTNDALLFGGVQYEMDSTAIAAANVAVGGDELMASRSSRGSMSFDNTDSTSRGGTWNYLKWTDKEVTSVESILKNAGVSTSNHKGFAATEESFKSIGNSSPSPRILHIATHGFFFPDPKSARERSESVSSEHETVFKMSDHPMIRSGLLLAGGNYAWQTGKPLTPTMDDGILTAYEISQMNLSNTELVVLSACETGLGDIEGNEGVYGLQRAFKIAGAKYLVMSLWQVPDQETSVFMTTFYRHWLEGKMTIPDAFRTTQQEMRERFINPYQWAGFVLVE